LIAAGNLDQHVRAVAAALRTDGLTGGRASIARIVGRDPDKLDEAAICRAAIESLAENASDGVTAPALWFLIGGLPGMIGYKAINTADSMIGHMSERHRAFGWAAARLDDLVNLPASRLTGLMFIATAAIVPGASAPAAWRAFRRDARLHRSPNAGWPEAAMAGALGLRLAGPRSYHGVVVDDHWMGDG
jgi:adenosylcobinamide-phosphate synthase